ncbi:MAG: FAD binding domain-containing protein [Clostridiales bacterium]|nr:FAD binding domain-containing protein [Clostridiales bacterium]
MRPFEVIHPASVEEAVSYKSKGNSDLMSGGTDLLNVYKHALLERSPETVVDLKAIPGMAGIEEKDGSITVKAMTTLTDIAESPLLQEKAAGLSEAARSVATPLIRNLGTIGGNICQDVRCWFYRYPHEGGGRMNCSRKGGDVCYAIRGENRYHSVFGGMKTHSDPCTNNCPASTDIPAYMAKIREGDWDAAARIIMKVNPMPMLTSRVCPHPCQDGCNQNQYGECVNIHCVERTLGDYILQNADRFYPAPEKESGKKTAVIGAGPGGLAAAYYLRKAGHAVTVFDSHEKAGGVFYYGIPHYRLPKNIVSAFTSAIEGMGVEFRMNTIIGKDIALEEVVDGYDSIYIGTGAWKQPVLGIQGEALTEFGLNFLVEVNTFLKQAIDDEVLVCGGGNVAMDVALTAKRLGAKHVRLVCLEQEKEMPASAEEVARAKEEGVEIFNGWGLKKVVTNDGKAAGLEAMRCVSVYNEAHRFSPVYDETDTRVFDATTIILATGQRVDLDFLGEEFGSQLKTPRGLFDTDTETYQTKHEKIYAGGDAVTGPNIAIRAINAGGRAAKAMSAGLGSPVTFGSEETGFLTFDGAGIKREKGARLAERTVTERTLTDEDAQSLSLAEAQEEAKRCMNCACYSVNASDIANMVVALDGTIITNKKEIPAGEFFTTKLKAYAMLDCDEMVTAIRIPDRSGWVTGYQKDRLRPSIDFALVALAYAYRLKDGKIEEISLVLGGVAPVPVKLKEVEGFLKGKEASSQVAAEAGKLAIRNTMPMEHNSYKIVDIEAMVKRMIEAIGQ